VTSKGDKLLQRSSGKRGRDLRLAG
jgi:hypothetical protein